MVYKIWIYREGALDINREGLLRCTFKFLEGKDCCFGFSATLLRMVTDGLIFPKTYTALCLHCTDE